jgi:hypothetical protein
MMRHQNLEFPTYDLLHEIAICELALNLERFQTGTQRGISIEEFGAVHREFVQSYDATPNFSMGRHPFDYSWSPTTGSKM